MARALLGEIPIEVGGKRYRFVLGTYGLKQLEQSLHKPWTKVLSDAMNDGFGVSVALALFHSGLLFHHENMTERQASLLLDELGIDKFAELFAVAVKNAMPEQESADPQQPTVGSNGSGTELSRTG